MRLFTLILFLIASTGLYADVEGMQIKPSVSSGKIVHYSQFASKYVNARDVNVWLPESYSPEQRFDVLYMHDGDMLFDKDLSWNGQSWEVDEVAGALIGSGEVKPFIVVGISNDGELRHSDYFPQRPWEALTEQQQKRLYQSKREDGVLVFEVRVASDNYLKFLVEELIPMIEKQFSVNIGPEHTSVMGSSMGGLISIYAISEYPDVFGAAACLSTHWPGVFSLQDNPIPDAFYNYLRKYLPDPESHRIYFDFGTETLDAMYPELQAKVDTIMHDKGFNASSWKTKRFEGAAHTESAWHDRLHFPLRFLFAK
jgi:predicted alpha/beta superfamily hydrolase